MFKKYPDIKQYLWGGALWAIGYYVRTVSDGPIDKVIKKYVDKQEEMIHKTKKTLKKEVTSWDWCHSYNYGACSVGVFFGIFMLGICQIVLPPDTWGVILYVFNSGSPNEISSLNGERWIFHITYREINKDITDIPIGINFNQSVNITVTIGCPS